MPQPKVKPIKRRSKEHQALFTLCCDIAMYRFGVGPYDFSGLRSQERGLVQQEAWEALETRLLALVGDPRKRHQRSSRGRP